MLCYVHKKAFHVLLASSHLRINFLSISFSYSQFVPLAHYIEVWYISKHTHIHIHIWNAFLSLCLFFVCFTFECMYRYSSVQNESFQLSILMKTKKKPSTTTTRMHFVQLFLLFIFFFSRDSLPRISNSEFLLQTFYTSYEDVVGI